MSDYRWWIIVGAWTLVIFALVCWLYKRVKREEPKYAMPIHVITGNDIALPRDPMKYEGRDLTSEQQELLREQNTFNSRRLSPAERKKAIECGFREEDEAQPFALDDPQGPRAA